MATNDRWPGWVAALCATLLPWSGWAAPSVPAPPRSVNRGLASAADLDRQWPRARSRRAQLRGRIAIDSAVGPAVLGSCHDIVVQAFDADGQTLAAVQGFGNLAEGSCQFGMFVPPTDDGRLRGFYGGPSGRHPGDYLELRGPTAFRLPTQAGRTETVELSLGYAFVR